MSRVVLNAAAGIVLFTLVAGASAQRAKRDPGPAVRMAGAARAFLATLDREQTAKAKLAFDVEERFNFHYIPRDRQGLPLKAMSPPQRQAALDLLRAGLSEQGFTKAETIRALDLVLREMGGNPQVRDPDNYYLTIFGDPEPNGVWGWRFEGHHLSQNWTIVGSRGIATSPQFFGANPAEVRTGSMKGTRALAAEEDLGRALVAALTPEQRRQAIIAPKAPNDIISAAERRVALLEDLGIAYRALNPSQQAMLTAIIELYAGAQSPEIARERLDRIRRAGLDRITFAWMGGTERGEGHYYRVQGPTFLIEYDNTQNQANHIHSVWRDFQGDFGRDLLAEHYKSAHYRSVTEDSDWVAGGAARGAPLDAQAAPVTKRVVASTE